MNETMILNTKDEFMNFTQGNSEPEYGILWKKILEKVDSVQNYHHTILVISQRVSDGKYFTGTYKTSTEEGIVDYDIELIEVFEHFDITRSFKLEKSPKKDILDVLYDASNLVETVDDIIEYVDEYAFKKFDDSMVFENAIKTLKNSLYIYMQHNTKEV